MIYDASDTSLIDQMRRELEHVEIDRDELRRALYAEFDVLDPETAKAEPRSSAFWFAMWREACRRIRVLQGIAR